MEKKQQQKKHGERKREKSSRQIKRRRSREFKNGEGCEEGPFLKLIDFFTALQHFLSQSYLNERWGNDSDVLFRRMGAINFLMSELLFGFRLDTL